MISRRAFALAAAALVTGGCALVSGYDFGKYTETGGAGGAGGHAAVATVSSGVGAASSTTSSGRPAGTGAGPASASASSSGATVGSSTSSSTSTLVTATSSSSGTGGSPSGTVTVLYDNLLGPQNLAIDPQNVYFTLNTPGMTAKSGAGYVSKQGKPQDLWYSLQDSVPAIWSTGSLVYLATNLTGVGHVYSFDVVTNQVTGAATVVNAVMAGMAVWGSTVFFTTEGASVWYVPPAGQPGAFVPNDIAAGPITADANGVFYVDTSFRVMQASLSGGTSSPIGTAPDTVWGITTDFAYVYWTDAIGGLYRATKGVDTVSPPLVTPTGTPAYGLAVDSSDTRIYFALGSNIEVASTLAGMAETVLATGLGNPRGVAVDDNYVYVADYGSGKAADGRILRITR